MYTLCFSLVQRKTPTKVFSIAGLQTASIVIPDKKIREQANRGINTDEVAKPKFLPLRQ